LKGALWAWRKRPEDLESEEQDVPELPFKCSRDFRQSYALREKLTQIFGIANPINLIRRIWSDLKGCEALAD